MSASQVAQSRETTSWSIVRLDIYLPLSIWSNLTQVVSTALTHMIGDHIGTAIGPGPECEDGLKDEGEDLPELVVKGHGLCLS